MKCGDLFQFEYINFHTRDINNKAGVFIGERPITREDGKVIPNFAVQLFGESTIRLCDAHMKGWMQPLDAK
ncbi:MAG: hypothetical protein GOVbin630_154 [Prokaryotic dsDNA virus sp.]|nr:MAG: hypothetical protein GOVbin630_154 [Prokaryotic dsDNA virus sp.]|tara:strand:- start:14486 stop:14698 length:213 start_codon:yes stop_codon:yes gene_type:complete